MIGVVVKPARWHMTSVGQDFILSGQVENLSYLSHGSLDGALAQLRHVDPFALPPQFQPQLGQLHPAPPNSFLYTNPAGLSGGSFGF